MKNLFEYMSYKSFLNDLIKNKPGKGHGYRTVMAEAAGCRVAFISQVLNSGAHFSLEQGESLNQLLGHTSEESDFFLLLIQYERAGTFQLQERLKKNISDIQKKRTELKNRIDIKEHLSLEAQSTYYSHWYYAFIHMAVSLPNYQTKESLSQVTHLPLEKVSEILAFLTSVQIIDFKNGKYHQGKARLFLPSDSPLISKHHINWHLQTMQSIEKNNPQDIHFTGLVTINTDDYIKIKEDLLKGLDAARAKVKESKNDNSLCCICLDFFKMI